MSVSSLIDQGLEVIKWPLAVASVAILLFSLIELRDFEIIAEIFIDNQNILVGFAIYFLLWLVYFSKPSGGSFFSTFEHELTHAVFARITFKRVTGLTATYFRPLCWFFIQYVDAAQKKANHVLCYKKNNRSFELLRSYQPC